MNTIQLSSSNALTDSSNRLKLTFRSAMQLSGYTSLSNINLWYNWKNITEKLNNNKVRYGMRDIVIPDGSYSVKDLNNFLHYTMEINGEHDDTKTKDSGERYAISLYSNSAYNRVCVKFIGSSVGPDGGIRFDSGLAKVVGAEAGKYYNNSTTFPNVPQLENVKSVHVHCNLVNNDYQTDSSLLYNFTPNLSYGSLLSIEPRYPQWRKTRVASENTIEVWLTDQDGRSLMLEDDWGVILQIADQSLIRL